MLRSGSVGVNDSTVAAGKRFPDHHPGTDSPLVETSLSWSIYPFQESPGQPIVLKWHSIKSEEFWFLDLILLLPSCVEWEVAGSTIPFRCITDCSRNLWVRWSLGLWEGGKRYSWGGLFCLLPPGDTFMSSHCSSKQLAGESVINWLIALILE